MYTRADPDTGTPTDEYMTHTNERIHRCVRIRLELEGLDLDDRGTYKATALLRKGLWRLVPAPAVSILLFIFYLANLTALVGSARRASLGLAV
jgi:hypothetical protein